MKLSEVSLFNTFTPMQKLLFDAALRGDQRDFTLWVECFRDSADRNSQVNTAIQYAALNNQTEMVEYLKNNYLPPRHFTPIRPIVSNPVQNHFRLVPFTPPQKATALQSVHTNSGMASSSAHAPKKSWFENTSVGAILILNQMLKSSGSSLPIEIIARVLEDVPLSKLLDDHFTSFKDLSMFCLMDFSILIELYFPYLRSQENPNGLNDRQRFTQEYICRKEIDLHLYPFLSESLWLKAIEGDIPTILNGRFSVVEQEVMLILALGGMQFQKALGYLTNDSSVLTAKNTIDLNRNISNVDTKHITERLKAAITLASIHKDSRTFSKLVDYLFLNNYRPRKTILQYTLNQAIKLNAHETVERIFNKCAMSGENYYATSYSMLTTLVRIGHSSTNDLLSRVEGIVNEFNQRGALTNQDLAILAEYYKSPQDTNRFELLHKQTMVNYLVEQGDIETFRCFESEETSYALLIEKAVLNGQAEMAQYLLSKVPPSEETRIILEQIFKIAKTFTVSTGDSKSRNNQDTLYVHKNSNISEIIIANLTNDLLRKPNFKNVVKTLMQRLSQMNALNADLIAKLTCAAFANISSTSNEWSKFNFPFQDANHRETRFVDDKGIILNKWLKIFFNDSIGRLKDLISLFLENLTPEDRIAVLNGKDTDGEKPLLFALQLKNRALLEFLIRLGANVNLKNDIGETPLHIALKLGNMDAARLLIEFGANINACTVTLNTPLHYLIQYRNINVDNGELLKLLIDKGASVNAVNLDMDTPLHILSRADSNTNKHLYTILTGHGANINACNKHFQSPLHLAIVSNNFFIAMKLIEQKAELNGRDVFENTPLLLSVNNTKLFINLLKQIRSVNEEDITYLTRTLRSKMLDYNQSNNHIIQIYCIVRLYQMDPDNWHRNLVIPRILMYSLVPHAFLPMSPTPSGIAIVNQYQQQLRQATATISRPRLEQPGVVGEKRSSDQAELDETSSKRQANTL